MKDAQRWYPRCGADFIHGTMGMTLEEKGAYSLCYDLIMDRRGPIPDDERWLAGVCGVSIRKWKSLRARLIELGKLVATKGQLMNPRAAKDIEKMMSRAKNLAENGAKGGRKRAENAAHINENNDVGLAGLKHLEDRIEDSVSNDTDAKASSKVVNIDDHRQPEADPAKLLFDTGVQLLTGAGVRPDHARSMLGKWRKDFGDGAVVEALMLARQMAPSAPLEFVTKTLTQRTKRQSAHRRIGL